MIKQPVSIVDCVDGFGESTNSFSHACFDSLDSIAHLKSFLLGGSIGQLDFECGLLSHVDKTWRLFDNFSQMLAFHESKLISIESAAKYGKVLAEENVKELCRSSEFKNLTEMCSASPYVVVLLQNIYQNSQVGIPGVNDLERALDVLRVVKKPAGATKKRKQDDGIAQSNKKAKVDSDDEEKNELTLDDVMKQDEQEKEEQETNNAEETRQSFGVKVSVFAHNESFRKLFGEQKKVEAVREMTYNKFRTEKSKHGAGRRANYAELYSVASSLQAICHFTPKKGETTPLSLLQPPLMEHAKLFPPLLSEHGFRFPLFDYQRRLLYWMVQRERQTLMFSAWPAITLDENIAGQLDDVAIPEKIQTVGGDDSDRNFFLVDGLLSLYTNRSGHARVKFSQRNDDILTNFCDKTCPAILSVAHYPHQMQHICRMLFGMGPERVSDDFLAQGFNTTDVPPVYVIDDDDIDDDSDSNNVSSSSSSSSSSSVSIVENVKKVAPQAAAGMLNHRVNCQKGPSSECHGECQEMQTFRASEKANLSGGTETCPLPIMMEALLRSAQSSAMSTRQTDSRISTRRVAVGNPYLFRSGVSCGRTGCGKTTMKIALIYVSKLWEDAQPESMRERLPGSNNFEALLPLCRRPLKLSQNFMTVDLAKIRQALYYANCTLVICPEQVVEQWFMEFVKTIGSGKPKHRPATGKNRAVLNGGVFGEIVDDANNVLLHIAVVRDASGLKLLELTEIIEKLDVVIVNQSLFRSETYRDNVKRSPVNKNFVQKNRQSVGPRLFEHPGDHHWIADAVAYERELITAAETKLEQSMLEEKTQGAFDFDSIPKPGFAIGRTLLHAIHWRRIVIDEAHLLSTHITPVERGIGALSGDFTWLVTATANFQTSGSFKRYSMRNEGGYGMLLHVPNSDDRTMLEQSYPYRSQFVQRCSATTSYEALPQLYLHRVPVQMTPEETAIYASLRNGAKHRMLRLLFCSHHMLNDQAWVQKNLLIDDMQSQQGRLPANPGDVVGNLMTVAEVAASMQSSRLKQIHDFNAQVVTFNQGFIESWLKFTSEETLNPELLTTAKQTVDEEIAVESEMMMNEPQNIKENEEVTVDFLGTISEPMLEFWQRRPEIRVAMTLTRLDSDLSKRASALRARYTINISKTRQPLLRQRERVLAEFNFFRNIFQRLSRPDEEIECPICLTDDHTKKSIVLTVCGHEFCTECSKTMFTKRPECVVCRRQLTVPRDLRLVDRITVSAEEKKQDAIIPGKSSVLETYGSKLATLISLIQKILKRRDCKKIIVYAQFQKLLLLTAGVLEKNGVNFVVAKGSIRQCEIAFRKFRYDNAVRVILLSSEKSISGVHLVEANHMIAVHPTLCSRGVDEEVATFMQAVARMRRLMQKDDCHVWQLITSNTIEEQQYNAQTVVLRSKYAMDVGIHWNAPEEEKPETTTPVVAKEISVDEKSRQDVVRLLNGNIEDDGEEGEEEEQTPIAEEVQEEVEEEEEVEADTEETEKDSKEEEEEKLPLNEWLSTRQYRNN